MQIQLLNGIAAANGAPTLVTHGVPLFKSSRDMQYVNPQIDGFYDNVDEATLVLKMTGAAPAISYLRIWGHYQLSSGAAGLSAPQGTDGSTWGPLGTGTGADKGKINGGAALDATSAGVIVHIEKISGLRDMMRFHLEVGAMSAAATLSAWLVTRGQAQP